VPKPNPNAESPWVLVCGDDEFAVAQRARRLYDAWCAEVGGMDHEIIEADAATVDEAMKLVARLREALQTLPLFGTGKVVWFRRCSLLGDDRVAVSEPVTELMAGLAQELKAFDWRNVRLLISAGKADKRRTFYRTVDKAGRVETMTGLSAEDKDWVARAERFVRQALEERGQDIEPEALAVLVAAVGPHLRQLASETEKVSVYAGSRRAIRVADVEAVVSRNKQSEAFGLGEALGNRDLSRALRRLDEDLWEVRTQPGRSAIGLLYGLISKIRVLILLQELLRAGWLKPETEYFPFKNQIERLPDDAFPGDKRYNPRLMHPFVLFKALPQATRYRPEELVRAMDLLLACNRRLVSTDLDEALVLQQVLVEIIGPAAAARRAPAARAPAWGRTSRRKPS